MTYASVKYLYNELHTGNSFGPAVDILLTDMAERLKMPTGCGEQTPMNSAYSFIAYWLVSI